MGGATRTPLIHKLLEERLGRPVHSEIEPDLAVALGASVQGGLIAGIDVGPILVDITPHTLGIEALGELYGFLSDQLLLADHRAEHAAARQPHRDLLDGDRRPGRRRTSGSSRARTPTRATTPWSASSRWRGWRRSRRATRSWSGFDLDLSGILKVTATERATGLAKHVVIDNAMERFRKRQRSDAVDRLEAVMGADEPEGPPSACRRRAAPPRRSTPSCAPALEAAEAIMAKAERVLPEANAEDADELRAMLDDLRAAVEGRSGRSHPRRAARGRGPGLLPGGRVTPAMAIRSGAPPVEEMRCPTCGARQSGWTDTCRRCKSDLRLLARRARGLRAAPPPRLLDLDAGRRDAALQHARRCHELRPGPESHRLLAVCQLLRGDWEEALELAKRV